MTTLQKVIRNRNLLKAFKSYRKRYLAVGKKPNVTKLLPNDLYHTMRLEGEKITKKEARSLFK